MGVTLPVLAGELNWRLIQNSEKHEEVLSVRRIDGSEITYNANTLYIGTLADIPALPQGRPLMFLCSDKSGNNAAAIPDNLNLLYPPKPLTVPECESMVMEMLEHNSRVNEGSRILYESLISGKGLEKITEAAQGIFNNLILVLDRDFKVLSFSDSRKRPADGIWKEILESGRFPDQYIAEISGNPDFSVSVIHKSEPVILEDGRSRYRYIMCRVMCHGNTSGFTVLVESNRRFLRSDVILIKTLSKIVSYDFKSVPVRRNPKKRIHDQFIAEILDGNLSDQQIQNRLAQIRLDLKKIKFVYAFGFIEEYAEKNEKLEHICDRIGMIVQTGRCTVYKGKVVMLVSSDTDTALPPAVNNELYAFVKINGMICGISNRFTDMLDLPKAFRQSQAVIRLGKRLQCTEYMLQYWTFSFLDMIESLQDKNNLLEYCNPTLLAMLDYDAENKTAYSKTLRHYIDSGKNPNQTAKELGVHRNTVDYRINRIRELFNVDFDNHQMIFSFELSYRIFYFIDKYYLDFKPNRFFLLN